jgi:hypothetical protein
MISERALMNSSEEAIAPGPGFDSIPSTSMVIHQEQK